MGGNSFAAGGWGHLFFPQRSKSAALFEGGRLNGVACGLVRLAQLRVHARRARGFDYGGRAALSLSVGVYGLRSCYC